MLPSSAALRTERHGIRKLDPSRKLRHLQEVNAGSICLSALEIILVYLEFLIATYISRGYILLMYTPHKLASKCFAHHSATGLDTFHHVSVIELTLA